MILNANSPKYREELWKAVAKERKDGKVICNLCGLEVAPGHDWKPWEGDWHESHIGVPKAHDGNTVGIAHKRCNELDNITFVIPHFARTKRLFRKHNGIDGPGLSKDALPAGRRSNITKKLNGSVEPRLSGSQKHQRTMAALWPNGRPE